MSVEQLHNALSRRKLREGLRKSQQSPFSDYIGEENYSDPAGALTSQPERG